MENPTDEEAPAPEEQGLAVPATEEVAISDPVVVVEDISPPDNTNNKKRKISKEKTSENGQVKPAKTSTRRKERESATTSGYVKINNVLI